MAKRISYSVLGRAQYLCIFVVIVFFGMTAVANSTPDHEAIQKCMRDENFSQALGTLVFEEIIRDHAKVVDPQILLSSILSGYMDPITGEKYKVSVVPDQQSENSVTTAGDDPKTKITLASKVLADWKSKIKTEATDFDFINIYAEKSVGKKSGYGLYVRTLENIEPSVERSFRRECLKLRNNHRDFTSDRKRDANWICSQKLNLDRLARCKIEIGLVDELFTYDAKKVDVDYFESGFTKNYKNVYRSWNEVLLTLDKNENKNKNLIHEVVIPANVLYAEDEKPNADGMEHQWYMLLKMDRSSEEQLLAHSRNK